MCFNMKKHMDFLCLPLSLFSTVSEANGGEKARDPCTVHTPTQRVRGNPAAALAAWRCPCPPQRPASSAPSLFNFSMCDACPKVAARSTSSDLQKQVGRAQPHRQGRRGALVLLCSAAERRAVQCRHCS